MKPIGCVLVILTFLLLLVSLARADTRHAATVRAFKRLTGYPHGRAGMRIDHKIPICAGGPDTVDNLQWQSLAESKIKDRFEVALCRTLKVQGYRLVKVVP